MSLSLSGCHPVAGRQFSGEWIVWHADHDGDELGHFVACRWRDDVPVNPIDLTPDLPPYTSFISTFSSDGWFTAPIVRAISALPDVPAGAEALNSPATPSAEFYKR